MNRKTFLTFVLPALPILCLGVTLLVFIFSLEYNTYTATFANPTLTLSPTPTNSATPAPPPNSAASGSAAPTQISATPVVTVLQPTPLPATPTPDPGIEKERERFLSVFKDIALVIAASIITFSSSYIGGLTQSMIERDKEERQGRRPRAQEYRQYLDWILKLGQRHQIALEMPPFLSRIKEKMIITEATIEKVVKDMPLGMGINGLEDENTQQIFDQAVLAAIKYVSAIEHGETPDATDVNEKYKLAIKALHDYEMNNK